MAKKALKTYMKLPIHHDKHASVLDAMCLDAMMKSSRDALRSTVYNISMTNLRDNSGSKGSCENKVQPSIQRVSLSPWKGGRISWDLGDHLAPISPKLVQNLFVELWSM